MAIVQWREECMKVVPVLNEAGVTIGQVSLLPGWNDIEDSVWIEARKWVKELIAKGVIVEKGTIKMVKRGTGKMIPGPNGKEVEETIEVEEFPKVSLRSLKIDEAEEVIKGTGNLATLRKWKADEVRESINKLLVDAIDEASKIYPDKEKAPPIARRKLF